MACCDSCSKTDLINNAKEWMQKVTSSPDFKSGSFKAYAKKHGGLDSDGKISESWAKGLIGDDSIPGHVRQQANLYLKFVQSK